MSTNSINAQAKASAKKQWILKLDDPKQARSWLKHVVRVSKIINATASLQKDWEAHDQIILTQSESDNASDVSELVNQITSSFRTERVSPVPSETGSVKEETITKLEEERKTLGETPTAEATAEGDVNTPVAPPIAVKLEPKKKPVKEKPVVMMMEQM